MISTPFNASFLTPSLLVAWTVDSGFGVFVAACVVEADGSPVDVTLDAPQADTMMDVMNNKANNFFIVVPCHCEPPLFGGEAISR